MTKKQSNKYTAEEVALAQKIFERRAEHFVASMMDDEGTREQAQKSLRYARIFLAEATK